MGKRVDVLRLRRGGLNLSGHLALERFDLLRELPDLDLQGLCIALAPLRLSPFEWIRDFFPTDQNVARGLKPKPNPVTVFVIPADGDQGDDDILPDEDLFAGLSREHEHLLALFQT